MAEPDDSRSAPIGDAGRGPGAIPREHAGRAIRGLHAGPRREGTDRPVTDVATLTAAHRELRAACSARDARRIEAALSDMARAGWSDRAASQLVRLATAREREARAGRLGAVRDALTDDAIELIIGALDDGADHRRDGADWCETCGSEPEGTRCARAAHSTDYGLASVYSDLSDWMTGQLNGREAPLPDCGAAASAGGLQEMETEEMEAGG